MISYELRSLCISNNYFTCGSTNQYNKMFDLADEGANAHDIALVIWLCSNDVKFEKIEKEVEEIIEKLNESKEGVI